MLAVGTVAKRAVSLVGEIWRCFACQAAIALLRGQTVVTLTADGCADGEYNGVVRVSRPCPKCGKLNRRHLLRSQ